MNFINLSTSYFYYLYDRKFLDLNTRNILALGYGLAGAAVYIVLQSYLYFVNPHLATNLWFGLALFALLILFPGLASYRYRKLLRYISFKEAFGTFFLSLLVMILLIFAYNTLVLNVLYSEEQLLYLKNLQTDFNISIMEQSNAKAADIEEARKLSNEMDPAAVSGLFRQSLIKLLLMSIIGMLFSLLMKNKATA
ncbi:DUF4199 family protein [Flavobacterium aurantiibacter]|uniref:DUF4199 domain-containing protein n=1 Tax=Flavobacterium aurantiibacter TaxID=2023067 RepID=A0A255ZRT4_9FLAO|nr:DUF4199 family protein [Flavobacterium aurantiibacter]OYQ44223.1 hypothetical protein CHX27_07895 [Flavobacterium aurantiibacter]